MKPVASQHPAMHICETDELRPGANDQGIRSSGGKFCVTHNVFQTCRLAIGENIYIVTAYEPMVATRKLARTDPGEIVFPVHDTSVVESAPNGDRPSGYVAWDALLKQEPELLSFDPVKADFAVSLEGLIARFGKQLGINAHLGKYNKPCGYATTKVSFTQNGMVGEHPTLYTPSLLAAHMQSQRPEAEANRLSPLKVLRKAEGTRHWLLPNLSEVKRLLDLCVSLSEPELHDYADGLSWDASFANPDYSPAFSDLTGNRHDRDHEFDPENYVTAYDHSDEEIMSALQRDHAYSGQLAVRGLAALSFEITRLEGVYCLSIRTITSGVKEAGEALRAQRPLWKARVVLDPLPQGEELLVSVSPLAILGNIRNNADLFDRVVSEPESVLHDDLGRKAPWAWMTVEKDGVTARILVKPNQPPDFIDYRKSTPVLHSVVVLDENGCREPWRKGSPLRVEVDLLPVSERAAFMPPEQPTVAALRDAVAEPACS